MLGPRCSGWAGGGCPDAYPLPSGCRHHGLLRPLPHQAEEAGDGDPGGRPRPSLSYPRPSPMRPSPAAELREGPWGEAVGPAEHLHAGLQVRVLELEKTLEVERVRLGELRKQHYMLAGAVGTPGEEEPGRPSAAPRGGTSKKPPLAQKPSVAPRQDHQVRGVSAGGGVTGGAQGVLSWPLLTGLGGSGPWGRSEATDRWVQTRGPSNAGSTAGAKGLRQGRQGPRSGGVPGA